MQFPILYRKNWASILLLAFGLFFYAYLYLFDFSDGISKAPPYIKGLKDLVLLVSLLAVLPKLKRYRPANVLIVFICALALQLAFGLLVSSAPLELFADGRNLLLGIAGGFALLGLTRNQLAVEGMLWFLMTFQAISSFIILFFFPTLQIWSGADAIGFIGNPNTFALCLNIAVALSFSRSLVLNFSVLALCGSAIVLSNSVSGLLLLLCITSIGAQLTARWVATLIAGFLILTSAALIETHSPNTYQVATHKLLIEKITCPNLYCFPETDQYQRRENFSYSYAGRRAQYRYAAKLLEDRKNWIVGQISQGKFSAFDGQYIQLLVNHGLLLTILYLIVCFYSSWSAVQFYLRNREVKYFLVLIAFLGTQVFSRILDYFPANMLFWYFIFLLRAKSSEVVFCRSKISGLKSL